MSNELATRTQGLQINTIDEVARVAKMMAESGYFSDAREAAQAGVKIMAGLAWGIDPFSAMTGINIIQGKPGAGAGIMAAKVKGSGRYDYRVREMTDKVCSIEFFEGSESLGVSTFTIEDAKKANTKNLDKFPRNMLFARAMSNGQRWYCPDVFTTPVYTPEELGADVDRDGNVVTVEAVEKPKAEKAEKVETVETVEATTAEAPVESPAEPVEGEFPEEPDFEVTAPIRASDASTITAALAPLKLSRDDARRVVSSVADRDVTTIKDLTRDEGELLAALTTDQWGEALDLLREPA